MVSLTARLSDEYLCAIGQVCANFSTLSKFLELIAWALISDDQSIGMTVTSEMSFKQVLSLVSSLHRRKESDKTKVAAFEKLLGRASDAEQRRNVIVHSVWSEVSPSGPVERVKYTARRGEGLRIQHEPMSPGTADVGVRCDVVGDPRPKSLGHLTFLDWTNNTNPRLEIDTVLWLAVRPVQRASPNPIELCPCDHKFAICQDVRRGRYQY